VSNYRQSDKTGLLAEIQKNKLSDILFLKKKSDKEQNNESLYQ
jgi:hypothetical protein